MHKLTKKRWRLLLLVSVIVLFGVAIGPSCVQIESAEPVMSLADTDQTDGTGQGDPDQTDGTDQEDPDQTDETIQGDIVIYGGSLSSVAAAMKAADNAPENSIILIAPYPTPQLGGIATTGGQNYWDVRTYKSVICQGGTFGWLYDHYSVGYDTQELSDDLIRTLEAYENITLYLCHDIKTLELDGQTVSKITIGEISRASSGYIVWTPNGQDVTIEGQIFIDTSEAGKLTRLCDNALSDVQLLTTGRYDWPSEYLQEEECNDDGVGLQATATLMFKVTDVQPGVYAHMHFDETSAWGGNETAYTNSILKAFNEKYGYEGYAIKALNASRAGEGSDEWWINALLVYNVDGRAAARDLETGNYPTDLLSGQRNTDEAWVQARAFLAEHADEFLEAFNQFEGFEYADFIYDADGYPVVADILYTRETVHMVADAGETSTHDESNYVISVQDCIAGEQPPLSLSDEADGTTVGYVFYFVDVHPYLYAESKWALSDWRPDLNLKSLSSAHPIPISYEALITPEVQNLLVAGYASSISSIAWGEVRVFSNLCVLGDAAGVAAAYCVQSGLMPNALTQGQVSDIQAWILESGGILSLPLA